jgi:ankyrin repeat protein
LLEAGADKDAQDADGMTPLYSAAAQNHFDIVALLLEAGAKKDQPNHEDTTSLYIAAENGHLESVRLLVESRAAIDHPLGPLGQGETPLMAAASEGYLEIVKLLVAFGARCDITKITGSLLWIAPRTCQMLKSFAFWRSPR